MDKRKLTKAEIVEEICRNTGYSPYMVRRMLHGFFSIVSGALEEGRTAELRGFGTFEPRLRKGRAEARNPKTGEPVAIGDRRTAVFRPGKELKKALRGSPEP